MNLSSATFRDVNLSHAKLSDINLSHLELRECCIEGVTIDGIEIAPLLEAEKKRRIDRGT